MSAITLDLLQRDAGLLWHPYASLHDGAQYAVTAATGAMLTLEDDQGKQYEVVDAMASWWSAVHGYRNPVLDMAAHAQIDTFSHVMFGGLTHRPAIELAERLVQIAPGDLRHVFLADSGSISVEVALKLALQYQAASGFAQRQRFLALRGGYHGDTFATMSVCDPEDGMHAAFSSLGSTQIFLPKPPPASYTEAGTWNYDQQLLEAWEVDARSIAASHAHELAGIIFEPMLQGAGGMHIYPPRVLQILREIANEHGMLLIADEIATGFGRTGKLFAIEWAQINVDIMCVGKALTGGYLTLAAMLCTPRVVEGLAGHDGNGAAVLLHGPTFMGNPLACAVAGASLDLLTGSDAPRAATAPWRTRVTEVQRYLRDALAPAAALASVKDVRVFGAVGVIQLHQQVAVKEVTRVAVEHGAWVRPFRDLVYVMPPYISTEAQIHTLGAALITAVKQIHGH